MGEARIQIGSSSEIEEIQDSIDKRFCAFKNFDVSYYPPYDHYFFNNNPLIERQPHFLYGSSKSKEGEQLIKFRMRMEQEREILNDNLPKSMYVRAYEGKIELMRALIIGLKGTPYAHGLFFFDILFPKDYPSKPPLIFQYYNQKLLDLNASALSYNDGKCLKLGSGFVWDPQTSNVYQILEFIQKYLLRTFRIYAKHIEKDFLLSRIAMIDILGSPPKGFEDFVRGHFRKSSHNILLKFKLEGNLSESEGRTALFFDLVHAFETNGSYCKHLTHEIKSETSSVSKQSFSAMDGSSSPTDDSLSTYLKNCMRWLCNISSKVPHHLSRSYLENLRTRHFYENSQGRRLLSISVD